MSLCDFYGPFRSFRARDPFLPHERRRNAWPALRALAWEDERDNKNLAAILNRINPIVYKESDAPDFFYPPLLYKADFSIWILSLRI